MGVAGTSAGDGLVLRIRDGGADRVVTVAERETRVATDAGDGIQLSERAGACSGVITASAEGWLYRDTGDERTQLNIHPLEPGTAVLLREGDHLQMNAVTLSVVSGGHISVLRIGRALDNDIVIDDDSVASYHAEVWRTAQGLVARRAGGTSLSVNGAAIRAHASLALGDTLQVGAAASLNAHDLAGHLNDRSARTSGASADDQEPLIVGEKLTRSVDRGREVILDEVDVLVLKGRFVALAGASGAGKSTLIKVLNGYEKPTSGTLLRAAGTDANTQLGYVPQEDILHAQLPLREALVMSALLRFPAGTPRPTVESRCDDLIVQMGLREHEATPVAHLSGGQRKRASIALELITEPRLLLLDEPTSGLDPANDHHLTALLRRLADRGYGVVLITHSTSNIALCDTVAFMAEGGRLVFWGSPDDARKHFGVESIEAVYDRIADDATPDEWRRRFEASTYFSKLKDDIDAAGKRLQRSARPAHAPRRVAAQEAWQLRGLIRRYAATLLAERRNLVILLAQGPVIVLLARLLFPGNVLTLAAPGSPGFTAAGIARGTVNDATHGTQLLFIVGATIVWLGTINAAREICKENAIWERERHVGLHPVPYLLSKLVVLGVLAAVQMLLIILLLATLWQVPGGLVVDAQLFGVALLAALAGVGAGLTLSAASPSSDRAMTFVPLAVIPQLLFAGTVVPLSDVGFVGRQISKLFAARWVFEGFGGLTGRGTYLNPPLAAQFGLTTPLQTAVIGLGVLVVVFSATALAALAWRSRHPVQAIAQG